MKRKMFSLFCHMNVALILLCCPFLLGPRLAVGWMINEDYQQRDNRAATDFHIWLVGDVKDRITGGGETSVTNPFADPKITKTKTGIGNTEVKFEGSNTIPKDNNTDRHFGIYGTGAKPKVRFKAWSYATSPYIVPVPKSNFDFFYDLDNNELTITVENISDDVVTFEDVGLLLFDEEQPISHLSRSVLPPEAFMPFTALDHEYLVGEFDQVVIPGVQPDAYAVTYGTVYFSGPSAGNDYNSEGLGTGGEWSQVAVIAQVPEPTVIVLLLGGTIVMLIRNRLRKSFLAALVCLLFIPTLVYAQVEPGWKRGNHAGDWVKGQTIKIKVDTPPGDAAQQAAYLEAANEAMAEWNVAQAGFGGLKLELATGAEAGNINISWHNDTTESTAAGGPPVNIHIGYARTDGGAGSLNSRAIARILKHELGHAEGLGHVPTSALMKKDAYSSNPPNGPSDADLESNDPFIEPGEGDKTGKKELWGTDEDLSRGQAMSNASFNGTQWVYDYVLQGDVGPGLIDPITSFILELPDGVGESSFNVTQLPEGWYYDFFDGFVEPGGRFDCDEDDAPSLLTFSASDPFFGVDPGFGVGFQIVSSLEPTDVRAYTGSPSYDTDEFILRAPVPEPTIGCLLSAMAAMAGLAMLRRRR